MQAFFQQKATVLFIVRIKLRKKRIFSMAVTNLLDRLAEEYEGNHPVEYRAQLAKLGKKIGEKAYSLGGGAKGVSARDIIRKDIKGNGVGVYPFDVLERQRNNKRKDESMPWDYAIQSKGGGMLFDSFNGGTKADANEYMAQLKANGIIPKDAKLVSNVSSSRQTARQKRDLDEFKKAFEDVRAQRDEYNSLIDKDDILGHYQDLSSKKTNMKLKVTIDVKLPQGLMVLAIGPILLMRERRQRKPVIN